MKTVVNKVCMLLASAFLSTSWMSAQTDKGIQIEHLGTSNTFVDFSQDFPAVTVTPTYENDGSVNLRLFIDRSSMELFEQEGRFVMTNLVFPTSPYTTLSFQAEEGSAKVNNLQIYSIKVD